MGLLVAAVLISFFHLGLSQSHLFRQIYPDLQDAAKGFLYFGLAVSFGGDQTSAGAIPAVQLALDHINQNPRVLGGHILKYTLTDSQYFKFYNTDYGITQCNRTDALDGLFAQLLHTPNASTLGIVDASCSVALEPAARISGYYNIPHLSCTPFSPSSHQSIFHNLFQMLPPDEENVQLFLGIIKQYKWKKVAILVQQERQFISTMNSLKERLTTNNIHYSEKRFKSSNILANKNDLFNSSARIFILAMFSSQARQILCKAYKEGMLFPRYVFLTYGSYESYWWIPPLDEDVLHACTPDNRAQVLNNSLSVTSIQFSSESTNTDFGIGGDNYSSEYKASLEVPPFYFTSFEYSQHCYDAVWTLALALNKTIQAGDLQNLEYRNKKEILKSIKETNFSGLTGNLSFGDDGRRRITRRRILQYRIGCINCSFSDSLLTVDVATVDEDNSLICVNSSECLHVWPDGVIPYDGVPLQVIDTVLVSIAAVYYVLEFVGFCLCIYCLYINHKYKNFRLFSSPSLNYFIVVGVILIYISVGFLFVPSQEELVHVLLCNIQLWTLSIGYTFVIGAIIAKLFRIYYYISYAGKLKKKPEMRLHESKLAVFVGCLAVFDVLMLVIYTACDGIISGYHLQVESNKENPLSIEGDQDIITEHKIYTCASMSTPLLRSAILLILLGYNGILQFVAIFLIFRTRSLKKGSAKLIAGVVYITSIQFVINFLSIILLKDYLYIFPILFATTLLVGATATLGCIFLPMLKSTEKDEIEVNSQHTHSSLKAVPSRSYTGLINRIRELENTINNRPH